MITIDREIFENSLLDAGLEPDTDLRDDYSGRGMYGETCIGIVCAPSEYTGFIASYAIAALDDVDCGWLNRVASDNMGRSMIYYWPGVQFS